MDINDILAANEFSRDMSGCACDAMYYDVGEQTGVCVATSEGDAPTFDETICIDIQLDGNWGCRISFDALPCKGYNPTNVSVLQHLLALAKNIATVQCSL